MLALCINLSHLYIVSYFESIILSYIIYSWSHYIHYSLFGLSATWLLLEVSKRSVFLYNRNAQSLWNYRWLLTFSKSLINLRSLLLWHRILCLLTFSMYFFSLTEKRKLPINADVIQSFFFICYTIMLWKCPFSIWYCFIFVHSVEKKSLNSLTLGTFIYSI